MGLAAQQTRLLTITGRKSDCEFRSMSLSHEKISLSRNMTDISNEYQNSLEQTKLVYDFYGTGSQDTPLSYNMLMTPSALNDYMPTMITDPSGRTVLDSKYAAAARAAGIPQEGIGGLPSDIMRNAFIIALSSQGVISAEMRDNVLNVPYNQGAGLGGSDLMSVTTTQGNRDELYKYLFTNSISQYGIDRGTLQAATGNPAWVEVDGAIQGGTTEFSLADLLNGKDVNIIGQSSSHHGTTRADTEMLKLSSLISQEAGIIDWMYEEFANVLDTGDAYTQNALSYALNQCKGLFTVFDSTRSSDISTETGRARDSNDVVNKVRNVDQNHLGFVHSEKWENWAHTDRAATSVNLNNIAKAFLTYFAQYMEGVASEGNYNASKGNLSGQNIVTNDPTYIYTIKTGAQFSTGDAKNAAFYDTLFNQLCTKGWSENANITDNEYLKNSLKSGMTYITSPKDDGFYYQGNYATDKYVKEVTDSSAIAKAEARYNTEKVKLNQKEQILDLKMKNLDTEISALTTEYDSVKSVITKNIEKTFKRYQA